MKKKGLKIMSNQFEIDWTKDPEKLVGETKVVIGPLVDPEDPIASCFVEALTTIGGALGALVAALKGVEFAQRRRRSPDSDRPSRPAHELLSVLETRMSRVEAQAETNRDDIRRILERQPPPDLSERVERLEDDVRQNATAVAARNDRTIEALAELRTKLVTFMERS